MIYSQILGDKENGIINAFSLNQLLVLFPLFHGVNFNSKILNVLLVPLLIMFG
jgi:hypothetical protein